ncbi:MAG: 50S ribosomal protein L22 [Pseudomonadota bacterium]
MSTERGTATAGLRGLKGSSQKVNLVLKMIRGKDVSSALKYLAACQKRVAKPVKKVVESAIANAENNFDLDVDRLVVAEATVGKAFVLKRWKARARGRAGKILKPYSDVRIMLREE